MFYIKIFLNYLKLSIKWNFWQNIILFVICITLIILLFKSKINYNTLKITYLKLTIFISSFYILFYFGLSIYFRAYNDTPINLYKFQENILKFYHNWLEDTLKNKIYILFLILIFICFWVVIFIKIRKLAKIEFYKLHLYLTFFMNKKKQIKFTSYGTFWYSLKISGYTFQDFIVFCYMLNYRLSQKINNKKLFSVIRNHIIDRIKYLPLLLLFFFIYYDYKYNNGNLYLLYKYMPLYLILNLYIQVSTYFAHEKIPLMRIFFERYYCFPHIIYVNLTLKEEEVLNNWINRSYFYRANKNEPLYILMDTQLHPIQIFHRFVLKHKMNIPLPIKSSKTYNLFYYNENTNTYFYYKYLQVIDGKYFFNDKNKYTYNYGMWIYYILEKNQPPKKVNKNH